MRQASQKIFGILQKRPRGNVERRYTESQFHRKFRSSREFRAGRYREKMMKFRNFNLVFVRTLGRCFLTTVRATRILDKSSSFSFNNKNILRIFHVALLEFHPGALDDDERLSEARTTTRNIEIFHVEFVTVLSQFPSAVVSCALSQIDAMTTHFSSFSSHFPKRQMRHQQSAEEKTVVGEKFHLISRCSSSSFPQKTQSKRRTKCKT